MYYLSSLESRIKVNKSIKEVGLIFVISRIKVAKARKSTKVVGVIDEINNTHSHYDLKHRHLKLSYISSIILCNTHRHKDALQHIIISQLNIHKCIVIQR